jgi:hypothetical protein
MPEIGDTIAFVDWFACTPRQNTVNVDPDITTLHIPWVYMYSWAVSPTGVEVWSASGSDVINSVTDISISATPFKAGLSAEATIETPERRRFYVTITNSGSFDTGTTYALEISARVNWYSAVLGRSFNKIYTFKQYLGLSSVGTSEWEFTTAGPPPPPLRLISPENNATGVYINSDWLLQFRWEDRNADDISLYTVWLYDPAVGWMEQTDRSRYSLVGYSMWLGYTLQYNTTYEWFVRKSKDGVDYDSPAWTFTTEDFKPPVYSYRWKVPYGGGDPVIVPSGENNQITVKRLIAAANNTIYYEDV